MSAIARILAEQGESVTGSDQTVSVYSQGLEALGVPIAYGHRAENIAGADVLLVSSAIPAGNPELAAALEAGLPVMRRERFLAELTAPYQVIAAAGTHGKTTTTGLIAWILSEAGLDPSFIVGGVLLDFGSNAHAGSGKAFVIEADEYDRAFLGLHPDVAVVTSVEHDHPDCFPTPESFRAAFQEFAAQVERTLIVCADDPAALALESSARRVSYGLSPEADWHAEEIRPNGVGGSDFLVLRGSEVVGLVRTRLPGDHNVRNTLAALAVADDLGVPFAMARQALTGYRGASRRSEVIGQEGGVVVVDDYAHHPSEIRATLSGLRQRYPERSLWAVFQPHTYSRVRALLADFAACFSLADHVRITDIFPAREQPDGVTTGPSLAESIRHPDCRYSGALEESARALIAEVKSNSVVVTLSAGDGNVIGKMLLEALRQREGGQYAEG
ncbi:MAG: UDP-N-acetylmuramate--L-alanine ligase [Anaerolineales bacterium]|nr:UDP-N-acetylmuramate--L-alanine ligase [Anaerolineales bacterium]